jgi:FHA domain
MSYQVVDGILNPQLLSLQDGFSLSGFAFVVQCSNAIAPLLLERNPALTLPRYSELETIEENWNDDDRETPCIANSPTAWLFPRWKPRKVLYIFGKLATRCDILLPHDQEISRKHFAIYLSYTGVWMVKNLSRYGTWINGDLLGLPESGKDATETALNPDSSNAIRFGLCECFIHPIPHTPLASNNDQAFSMLLELENESEGSRTTSATESTSVIYRPSHIRTEPYHYLPKRPIVVRGKSQICVAIHKSSGQHHIAKIYGIDEESDRAAAQFEMMLDFKV